MKNSVSIGKVINTLILFAILIVLILILKKVNRCCDCNKDKSSQEMIFTLRTAEAYDSLTHKKGTHVWIDMLPAGQEENGSMTIWNDCPEKEAKKAPVIVKKYTHKEKVITKLSKSVIVTKEELVKKDTCLQSNLLIVNNLIIDKPNTPGLLKIDLEKVTSNKVTSIYSQVNVLPTHFDGISNTTQFNYDIVPDLHLQEYIKKAKKHLWIGTGLASAGAIAYASTMFCEIPTFVDYNGLNRFDPANKYYDHNVLQRERLNTLKWVRGVSVAVGVIGGVEVIHGILLLKNADVNISPQKITLKYSF